MYLIIGMLIVGIPVIIIGSVAAWREYQNKKKLRINQFYCFTAFLPTSAYAAIRSSRAFPARGSLGLNRPRFSSLALRVSWAAKAKVLSRRRENSGCLISGQLKDWRGLLMSTPQISRKEYLTHSLCSLSSCSLVFLGGI